MLTLPKHFIVFDTEFTTWEGAMERNWTGPNEHREIVQIAAAKVVMPDLQMTDTFMRLVQPVINPRLSSYFINLTGLTQERVDAEGRAFPQAITDFAAWAGEEPLYCYGVDFDHLAENCRLVNMAFPFGTSRFGNIKEVFKAHGIAADKYMSSTIVEAFGVKPSRPGHDALNDVRTIVDALKLLQQRPSEGP